MKPLQYYIQNGLAEDYCLGLLDQQTQREVELAAEMYQELRAEINGHAHVLARYARRKAVEPHGNLEQACWLAINQINLEENMNFGDTPLITSYSDAEKWERLVLPHIGSFQTEQKFFKIIKEEPLVVQYVLWLKQDSSPEIHVDEEESLLVLDGSFNLVLGEKVRPMKKGDFVKIPLDIVHYGQLTSEGTLLIVQRRKLKAS